MPPSLWYGDMTALANQYITLLLCQSDWVACLQGNASHRTEQVVAVYSGTGASLNLSERVTSGAFSGLFRKEDLFFGQVSQPGAARDSFCHQMLRASPRMKLMGGKRWRDKFLTISCGHLDPAMPESHWTFQFKLVLVTQLCLILCDPTDCSPAGSSVHAILQNTEVGCHSLLQGVFPIQGSNPDLLHCRQILDLLSHQGGSSVKGDVISF